MPTLRSIAHSGRAKDDDIHQSVSSEWKFARNRASTRGSLPAHSTVPKFAVGGPLCLNGKAAEFIYRIVVACWPTPQVYILRLLRERGFAQFEGALCGKKSDCCALERVAERSMVDGGPHPLSGGRGRDRDQPLIPNGLDVAGGG